AVLSATPRGIELSERRRILPELVWRLQWLPGDHIAAVVQLQANDLKHETGPVRDGAAARSLDLRVEELLRTRRAHIGLGDEGRTGIDIGRYLLALRGGERGLDAVIAHAERVLHDQRGERVGLQQLDEIFVRAD